MKLRSIALSGLLGAGLLITSGCTEDIIEDILKANVIYTVNGTVDSVVFAVTGDSDTTPVESQAYTPHLLTGSSNYDVSYTGITPVAFPYGSVYTYIATNCAAEGYLQHEINANKVNFVNISGGDIPGNTNSIVITQADGTEHNVTEPIGDCGITGVTSLDGMVFEQDMNVSIGGTVVYTVPELDPGLAALGSSLHVDIVLFDGNMTVVPMLGYDDLLAIGVGAL